MKHRCLEMIWLKGGSLRITETLLTAMSLIFHQKGEKIDVPDIMHHSKCREM
jgi:hypothetical protein